MKLYDIFVVFAFVAVAVAAFGWIFNIVKLVSMVDGGITTMFILRIVGVLLAPFGSIMGYL